MNRPGASAQGLLLVSASAGSGKTYRLTQEVTQWLSPTVGTAVGVEGLIAVTYTTKAQAELESRLRRALVQQGQFGRAESLPLAYLGTVHAVCLRLLKEFALDAGLSPAVDGLPQEAARRLLQEALERELSPELRQSLDEAALALELNWDHRVKRCDWITPVEQIMTLARNNRLRPETLSEMAKRSSRGMLDLLGPPVADGAVLEQELAHCVAAAITAITALNTGQQNTKQALQTLREAQRQLRNGRFLPWSRWCKLSKVNPGKVALPLVAEVQRVAAQYELHPQFQAQIAQVCELIFEAARRGLSAYAQWKAQRGLVDYIDMIDHALSILDVPEVEAELKERLELLVVDEFQDTSPVQLALFSRLHRLCKRSLWVGDRKQCIFEYAGADPTLMDAAARWVVEQGGETEVLGKNYRSRPELVESVSHLFSHAFGAQGHSPREVVTQPQREALPALAGLPAFGMWWLRGKRHSELEAVAEGIRRLLADPSQTRVLDRETGQVRPVCPGDIAVLVATNREAEKLATALKQRGVASALARTGLMTTPEGTLLSAALRFLLDPADTLASAEVEALLGFGDGDHEAWLSQRIRDHAAKNHLAHQSEPLQRLEELRTMVARLSPLEVVQHVLAIGDFPRLTRRWPDPEQRLANLDALRALTAAYESRSSYLREAASLAGLLRYFEETQIQTRQQDEERASDEQHLNQAQDAVVLSTYHKSKGLEWPVVVLASLDRERKRDAFEVAPQADRDEFDANDPLGQRWIRYWPWPLGQQRNAPLRERAEACEVGQRIAERDARERVRLLYVGFTRARDHLVLAVPMDSKGKVRKPWLDELRDEQGPLLSLPDPAEEQSRLQVRGIGKHVLDVPTRVWELDAEQEVPLSSAPAATRLWFGNSLAACTRRLLYTIQPSNAIDSGLCLPQTQVVSQQRLAQRMPFSLPTNANWEQVGTALHGFLAADEPALGRAAREALAERTIQGANLGGAFEVQALIGASDAWRSFVEQRWPGAQWYKEVPVVATLDSPEGPRQIQGTIDLWLETDQGGVLVDHKSFPGRSQQWTEQALKHAPQLLVYRRALEAAGKRVLGQLIHFTVGGGVVELTLPTSTPP